MTFNQLFTDFKNKYGSDHDVVFFTLVFYCSKNVKDKNDYVNNHNTKIDFQIKVFNKLCNDYFVKQKPLAHIIGHWQFCNLDFIIDKKVLVPRENTQQMVLDFIGKHHNERSANVLDLCCGCGCIGISIKKYIEQFSVTCVDKYWGPILNTRKNGIKHKTKLTVDCADAIKFLNRFKSIDYLISNPPYINAANFNNKKMFKWENKNALIAKDHGLYFYKKYFDWLSKHDFKEAWLEIGYDLTQSLKEEAKKYPKLKFTFINDQYLIIS